MKENAKQKKSTLTLTSKTDSGVSQQLIELVSRYSTIHAMYFKDCESAQDLYNRAAAVHSIFWGQFEESGPLLGQVKMFIEQKTKTKLEDVGRQNPAESIIMGIQDKYLERQGVDFSKQ